MQDLSELFKIHPNYLNSLQYIRASERQPKTKVFIFSQPRSGSTLILRLLAGACMTNCVGDKNPEFYQSILNLYKEIRDNNGLYCNGFELERGPFPDEYRGFISKEREFDNFRWQSSGLLFNTYYAKGYCKTTSIGFCDDNVEEFCEMLRDLYEYDDLRIVWLSRDPDEIVKSFQTREGPGQNTAIKDPELLRNMIAKQKQDFNKAYRLGDVVIKYSDLIADPIKYLKRLAPVYNPNKKQVERIMANVMR